MRVFDLSGEYMSSYVFMHASSGADMVLNRRTYWTLIVLDKGRL